MRLYMTEDMDRLSITVGEIDSLRDRRTLRLAHAWICSAFSNTMKTIEKKTDPDAFPKFAWH